MTLAANAAVRVAVPVPLPRLFDYLPPADGPPPPGSRVLVPFGRRHLVGLVMAHGQADTELELKPIERVLDRALIPLDLLALLDWCQRYYAFAPGESVQLLLPGALRRSRSFRRAPPQALMLTARGRAAELGRAARQQTLRERLGRDPVAREQLLGEGFSSALIKRMLDDGLLAATSAEPARSAEPGPALNPDQRRAAAAVLRARHRFEALLLAGVTGSGKTEVYLRAAQGLLARGRQVLMLVPEIGLSPQLVRRIERRLGRRAWVYHSGLSEGERLQCWEAAGSGRAAIIVGTRSAVFLPLLRPGLIVVDEEHDASFKQQDGARYHGRDVAVLRARQLGIPVLLGSATPALESLQNAAAGRYRRLELPRRAGGAEPPRWRVLDQRHQKGLLDPRLLAAIGRHLEADGQVLVYRNRRGFAPVQMCNACGWQADCQRCSAHMTVHQRQARLQCHHCGATRPQPPRCPECGSPDLVALGSGTERLEGLLTEHFPDVPVHRVDRDSMSGRDDFEQLLNQVRAGGRCILVGTQMLAKGHHLPALTMAAVLDVDQALYSADFRAPERLGQIICQVAGRAGRVERGGEFYLQTRHPDHPLLADLLADDYLSFAGKLLAERHAAALPPASALALLRAESHRADQAKAFLQAAADRLRRPGLKIAGPIPAVMERRSGYWRFQLWLQAADRAGLLRLLDGSLEALHALPQSRRTRWHLDVDPVEL